MYNLHTYTEKQEKLAILSTLICKVAVVPEQYLNPDDVSAVIEYLCDIENDLISQLNHDPQA